MTMTIHSIPFHILFGCELLLCEIWWHMTIIHHQIQILFKLPLLLVNKHRKSPIFMWKTGRVGRICGKSHWASSLALDARQPSTAQRNARAPWRPCRRRRSSDCCPRSRNDAGWWRPPQGFPGAIPWSHYVPWEEFGGWQMLAICDWDLWIRWRILGDFGGWIYLA